MTEPGPRRRGRPRRRSSPERGAVTAEIATALPALVLVVVGALWIVNVGLTQLRCSDAAREAARALSRGDDDKLVGEIVEAVAPEGAGITTTVRGGVVVVEVSVEVPVPLPFGDRLPAPTVRGTAAALEESS